MIAFRIKRRPKFGLVRGKRRFRRFGLGVIRLEKTDRTTPLPGFRRSVRVRLRGRYGKPFVRTGNAGKPVTRTFAAGGGNICRRNTRIRFTRPSAATSCCYGPSKSVTDDSRSTYTCVLGAKSNFQTAMPADSKRVRVSIARRLPGPSERDDDDDSVTRYARPYDDVGMF